MWKLKRPAVLSYREDGWTDGNNEDGSPRARTRGSLQLLVCSLQPKPGDTVDDELLLRLLHALNKLPVDLNALEKSSVGKSVNSLRSHRNSEEEKSSSSSQSQNNSPSCSSCLGNASGSSCREDSKSSITVSLRTKALSLLFHHSASSRGITGSAMPGKQTESVVRKSLELVDTQNVRQYHTLKCCMTRELMLRMEII